MPDDLTSQDAQETPLLDLHSLWDPDEVTEALEDLRRLLEDQDSQTRKDPGSL